MEVQKRVILKVAKALPTGGRFLFTVPAQTVAWTDALTAQPSTSLGSQHHNELLASSGFSLLEEFDDEGGNHYYHVSKV